MEKFLQDAPKFSSPEEELAYLRAQIEKTEKILNERGIDSSKEYIASGLVETYRKVDAGDVLHPKHSINESDKNELVLRLRPEPHDKTMEELLGVLLEKGVKNALEVVERMGNPHIADDFHRFLIQYLVSTHQIPGLKEKTNLAKLLSMRLFEITIPPDTSDKAKDDPGNKILIASMEQFLAGMQSVGDARENKDKDYYSLEIALSSSSDEVVFYVGVPESKVDLLEKQVLGLHAGAKIREATDDYNIYNTEGKTVGAFASLSKESVFPIKTYTTLEYDPLNILLNVFSKLKKEGEGLAIQILVKPEGNSLISKFAKVLENVKSGKEIALRSNMGEVGHGLLSMGKQIFTGSKIDEKKKDEEGKQKIDENAVKWIGEKINASLLSVGIRVIASAETEQRAEQILHECTSAFNQFTEAGSNSINFTAVLPRGITDFCRDFTYRAYDEARSVVFNLKELATVYHFPAKIEGAPQLKQAQAGTGPAPVEMPSEGVLLGYNFHRGVKKDIYMSKEDRMRHLYVIGQTGTGKTSILKNLIAQDIANGEGCCFIDPHGSDIQDILSYIPPERLDDVIYFDPAYTARPMALNMLEYDERYPEQKTFVINELIGIFNQLFDMKAAGGPMFESYFRNAALLVMADPESGSTLMEITRVLQNKTFRDYKLSKCQDAIVKEFWVAAEASTGEQGLQNFVPYISSKFDPMISNDIMRPVIGQQKSVFNFRKIMDEKKILLVNLSKGRLGELNANLIGLILVGKIQMAALSRADMYGQKMNDFYLYIDEFQNVTTPAIASILSEARKYRLSLNIAHQYIAQLSDEIKDAVFGNVGSMTVFRVSPEDAEYLEPKFTPTFTRSDITKLENRNAYMSMIVKGAPTSRPFSILTADNPKGDLEKVDKLKELSYLKYGRPREEVEAEIMKKYAK